MKQVAAWPDEAPGNREELKEHIDTLIDAVTEVVTLKTDWAKIQTCRQRAAEDPLEFLERFRGVYQTYSGLKEEGVPFANVYINGLTAKLQNEIKRICIGWELKEVKDLMEYVSHCNSLIKQRSDEENESTLMLTQVQGQGDCPGGRNARYNAPTQGPTYYRQRPQWRDQRRDVCYTCGKPGHFSSECRNRRNSRTYSMYEPVEERRGAQYRDENRRHSTPPCGENPYYRQQERWGTQFEQAGSLQPTAPHSLLLLPQPRSLLLHPHSYLPHLKVHFKPKTHSFYDKEKKRLRLSYPS